MEEESESSTSSYYSLEYKRYKFYGCIKLFDDHDMIHIGNQRRCISYMFRYDHYDRMLTLLTAEHHAKCRVDEVLKRGTGTIRMLRIALAYVKSKYSNAVPYIEFSDESFIPCKNGRKLSLAQLYLVKYGKTWYEAKFRARPTQPFQDMYKECVDRLQSYVRSKPYTYSSVVSIAKQEVKQELQPIYEQSENIVTFVKRILEDPLYDCSVLFDWLPMIVSSYIPQLTNFTWMISFEEIRTKIECTLLHEKPSGVQFGGKDDQPTKYLVEWKDVVKDGRKRAKTMYSKGKKNHKGEGTPRYRS
jgi:hypothetical protein